MVRRSTWLVLGVFVVLAAFAVIFQRYQTNKAQNLPTATPTNEPTYVFNLSSAQVNDILISDSSGKTLDIYRILASSDWAIKDIPVEQIDNAQLKVVIDQLLSLSVDQILAQIPPLDSMGLITPAYTITLTTADGTKSFAYIGSKIAIGTGYYVHLNDGHVAVVSNVVIDEIINILTNPPLVPTATPEMTPTETVVPTQTVTTATPTP